MQAGQTKGAVGVTPLSNRVVVDTHGLSHSLERLATVEFEQSGCTFECLGFEGAFGKQVFQRRSVHIG